MSHRRWFELHEPTRTTDEIYSAIIRLHLPRHLPLPEEGVVAYTCHGKKLKGVPR